MKKLLFIIGLIAAIIFAYYGVSSYAPKIEMDIKTRLASAFDEGNVSNNIKAVVSGRDVTLTGISVSEDQKREAEKIAKNLRGVRAVNNDLTVADAPPIANSVDQEIGRINVALGENSEVEFFEMDDMDDTTPTSDVNGGAETGSEAKEQEQDAVTPVEKVDLVVEATVAEVPVVETQQEKPVGVAPADVTLDRPLSVINGRVIRRKVDAVIAVKTVEAECEADLTSILSGHKINYETASAKIHKNSYDLLDRLIVAAKNCHKDTIITVNGYTDNVGNVEYNRQLSLKRARSVGQYMLKRGVAKQVKVVGHGENDPIADNDTEEGRAKNRRIEFKVFKAKN